MHDIDPVHQIDALKMKLAENRIQMIEIDKEFDSLLESGKWDTLSPSKQKQMKNKVDKLHEIEIDIYQELKGLISLFYDV